MAPEVPASAPEVEVSSLPPSEKTAPVSADASSGTAAPVAPTKQPRPAGSQRSQQQRASQRVQAPQRQERFTFVTIASAIRSLTFTFAAAVIVATIFMWWTSPDFLSAQTRRGLAPALATAERSMVTPTSLPTPIWFNKIGIIAGHNGIATYGPTKGNKDPGTVCPDGFYEASVTLNVAKQVVAALKGRGFDVDLLDEYDLRLDGYQAAAFISLHADSCDVFNDGFQHTGFKSTYPTERYTIRDRDELLNNCIRQNYEGATGLPFTPGSITEDMTNYHAFHRIAPRTPAAILELGFLSYDRDLLQNHTDRLAQGIVNGLLCFLQPADLVTSQAPVPSPTRPLTVMPTATQKP